MVPRVIRATAALRSQPAKQTPTKQAAGRREANHKNKKNVSTILNSVSKWKWRVNYTDAGGPFADCGSGDPSFALCPVKSVAPDDAKDPERQVRDG